MNFLRKLELSGGMLIFGIGLFVTLSDIRLDQESAERLGREFEAFRTILVLSLIDLLPGILILIGAYIHSVKGKQPGQFLLIVGALANLIIFGLFVFSPVPVPYGRVDLFWLEDSAGYFLPCNFMFISSRSECPNSKWPNVGLWQDRHALFAGLGPSDPDTVVATVRCWK